MISEVSYTSSFITTTLYVCNIIFKVYLSTQAINDGLSLSVSWSQARALQKMDELIEMLYDAILSLSLQELLIFTLTSTQDSFDDFKHRDSNNKFCTNDFSVDDTEVAVSSTFLSAPLRLFSSGDWGFSCSLTIYITCQVLFCLHAGYLHKCPKRMSDSIPR